MADRSADDCRLREIGGWSLVQVAAWPATAPTVAEALSTATGVPVPNIGTVARAGTTALFQVAPGQFWILDESGTAPNLRLDAEQGIVTPLTDGRRRYRIEGAKVRDILAKVVSIDLDPARFGIGQAALTGIHHLPVLLIRVGEVAYDILMPRSFAECLTDWLADAGLEFGMVLDEAGA